MEGVLWEAVKQDNIQGCLCAPQRRFAVATGEMPTAYSLRVFGVATM